LDLFLRTVNEPNLLKLFLKFVLYSKFDERITLLDTLLARINSCDKLSMATLMLFYTMIELNSEDVMYRLVFAYLAPLKHVAQQPPAPAQTTTTSTNSLSPAASAAAKSQVTSNELTVTSVRTFLGLATHLNNFEPSVVNINSEKYNYIQPTSSIYLNENYPINQWLNSM
jgi:hypothetical protein